VIKRTQLMARTAETIFNAVLGMMTFEQFMIDLLVLGMNVKPRDLNIR